MDNLSLLKVLKCKNYRGFQLEEIHYIKEQQCNMWLLSHPKSGAQVAFLDSDDPEKTFSMSFKTIPQNDTGVFHIIEHNLVLTGSRSYPSKYWPGRKVLHSFHSGFTMRGTSMYPVSSCDESSFQTLVRLYVDGIFSPLLVDSDLPFLREGWHYQFDEEGNLGYSGIVYSEMKACEENPEFMLHELQLKAAYPGTSFAYHMGGAPEAIPSLTYQELKETYQKTFVPENCLIYVNGNTCLASVLDTLDGYLVRYPKTGKGFSVDGTPKPWNGKTNIYSYPLLEGENPSGRDMISFNWYIGQDPECAITADILAEILRPRLMKTIPEAIPSVEVHGDYYWPLTCIVLRNAEKQYMDDYRSKVNSVLQDFMQVGATKQEIQNALTAYRFRRNERVTFVPEGINLGICATNSWARGQSPWSLYQYTDTLQKLEKRAAKTNLRDIVADQFVRNTYYSELIMAADPGLTEIRLNREKESLRSRQGLFSPQELQILRSKNQELKHFMETEDPPALEHALPETKVKDLPKTAMIRYPEEVSTQTGPIVFVHEPSNVIRVTLHYNLDELSEEECSLLGILRLMFGSTATNHMDMDEIQENKCRSLGTIQAYAVPYTHQATDFLKYQIQFTAFEEQLESAQNLVKQLIVDRNLDQPQSIKELLHNFIVSYRFTALENAERAASYCSHSAAAYQHYTGYEFYRYATVVLVHFERNYHQLLDKLRKLAQKIYEHTPVTVGISCHRNIFTRIKNHIQFASASSRSVPWHTELLQPREAIKIPGMMQSTAIAGKFSGCPGSLRAACVIAEDIAAKLIRDIGGAYTVQVRLTPEKSLLCLTDRDPHLGETITNFQAIIPGVQNASSDVIQSAIITAAGVFTQNSPAGKIGFVSQNTYDDTMRNYFNGMTPEIQQRQWEELISATEDEVRNCGILLEKALAAQCYCCAVSEDALSNDARRFDRVIDFGTTSHLLSR